MGKIKASTEQSYPLKAFPTICSSPPPQRPPKFVSLSPFSSWHLMKNIPWCTLSLAHHVSQTTTREPPSRLLSSIFNILIDLFAFGQLHQSPDVPRGSQGG